MAETRQQVNSAIEQSITDELNRQNTAAVVRAAYFIITANYFNLAEDLLPLNKVTDLVNTLAAKADLVNGKVKAEQLPAFSAFWGAMAKAEGDNQTVQQAIDAAVAALVASSPAALDTLNELATALGNDANFAATINAAIAAKISSTEKGAVNGVATLDATGKVPASQLPEQTGAGVNYDVAHSNLLKFGVADPMHYGTVLQPRTAAAFTIDETSAVSKTICVFYNGTEAATFAPGTIAAFGAAVQANELNRIFLKREEAGRFLMVVLNSKTGAGTGTTTPGGETGTAPVLQSAYIADGEPNAIYLQFDKAVTFSSGAGFTISGTTSTTFASASGSGTSLLKGVLAANTLQSETITVSYNATNGNIIAQAGSVPLASFLDAAVINADTVAPALVLASIGGDGANVVRFTYDEELAPAFVPAVADYNITIDGNVVTVTGITVNGATVLVTLAQNATNSSVLTASYTPSVGKELQDASGNKAAALASAEVANGLDNGVVSLTAQDADYTYTDANITGWTDRSGSSNNAASIGTVHPVKVAAAVNGKDALYLAANCRLRIDKNNFANIENGLTIIQVVSAGSQSVLASDITRNYLFDSYQGFLSFTDSFEVTDFASKDVSKVSYVCPLNQYAILVHRWIPGKETAAFVNGVKYTAAGVSSGFIQKIPEQIEGGNTGVLVGTRINNWYSSAQVKEKLLALANEYGIAVNTAALTDAAPTIEAAAIGRQADNVIRLYFNHLLDVSSKPVAADFSLAGTTATITSLTVGSAFVDLLLSVNATAADVITVSYTGTKIKSKAAAAPTFSNYAVTNCVLNDSTSVFAFDFAPGRVTGQAYAGFSEQTFLKVSEKNGKTVRLEATSPSNRQARVYKFTNGIPMLTNHVVYGGMAQYFVKDNTTNVSPYSSTNGLTLIAVFGSPHTTIGAIFSKWHQLTTNGYNFRLKTDAFTISPDGTETNAVTITYPALTANKLHIVVARWLPSTLMEVRINGEKVSTNAASIPASIMATAAELHVSGEKTSGTSVATSSVLGYASAYNSSLTNAEIKTITEQLGKKFRITVDTTGL